MSTATIQSSSSKPELAKIRTDVVGSLLRPEAVKAARVRAKGDEDSGAAAAALCDQVEALQGHNRRILAQLRPVALEEYGLLEALRILVEQWRKTEPAVTLILSASDRIADLGQRASLMAYRFVQEALTNAFRHSGARRVDVTLAYASGTAAEGSRDPALAGLRISICDDGRGLAEQAPLSLGLLGMRERVRALGGAVAVGRSGEGGGGTCGAGVAPSSVASIACRPDASSPRSRRRGKVCGGLGVAGPAARIARPVSPGPLGSP